MLCQCITVCRLICTLISENQGPFQALEKFQIHQTLIFVSGLHSEKKLGLYYKPEKIQVPNQKSGFAEPEIFLGF